MDRCWTILCIVARSFGPEETQIPRRKTYRAAAVIPLRPPRPRQPTGAASPQAIAVLRHASFRFCRKTEGALGETLE